MEKNNGVPFCFYFRIQDEQLIRPADGRDGNCTVDAAAGGKVGQAVKNKTWSGLDSARE